MHRFACQLAASCHDVISGGPPCQTFRLPQFAHFQVPLIYPRTTRRERWVDQTGLCADLWISDELDDRKRIAFSINQ